MDTDFYHIEFAKGLTCSGFLSSFSTSIIDISIEEGFKSTHSRHFGSLH